VGGGINGVGIARDAAGRGLSVVLVERDDLASHTSSASSKLIHGGLRYLEQLDFRLVRQSLAEREVLLRSAPHIVRPLRFVIPLSGSARPAWTIRLGLFLYDTIGQRKSVPGTETVDLDRPPFGDGLRHGGGKAFAYWDCRVDDSRLVILNARDAANRGATILTRTELLEARRSDGVWSAVVRDGGGTRTLAARALVNAAGPWAGELLDRVPDVRRRSRIRLVKGSHIVLRRLYAGDHAFLLQNPDGRVVFAIAFERDFTLVGTTDVECERMAGPATISDGEVDYLLETAGRTFTAAPGRADVVWSYSGVRALRDDGSANPSNLSRDYALELDADAGRAPLLTVIGGKITTHRRLAEDALKRLALYFPESGGDWTANAVLPGGDLRSDYRAGLAERFALLPADLLDRLAASYGARAEDILRNAIAVTDLGEDFGSGLFEREVDYLIAAEWARTAEDVLFRRTKLGLRFEPAAMERLERAIADRLESVSRA
jgi:glycerol-3-phosphate dehydrogenase